MMATNFLQIDGQRLWDTLEASGRIGKLGETGLRRMALTDEDKEMRDLFVRWCRDAGCTVEVDEVGNIFARRAGHDNSLPPVAVGSHLDTQIFGGKYDGILGVLSGLEVIRTLNDRDMRTQRPIELIAWSDEEGARFSHSMMGSSAFAGIYPVEAVLGAVDLDGKRFGDELRRIGYAGSRQAGGHVLDSYFELHIEQGPTLDAEGIDVGIITGSYSVHGFNIEITGDNAHVGPTPMDRRRNALVGAGYLIAAVNDIGWKYHPEDGKTTISRVECEPNRYGIIPHKARLTIDYRHNSGARAAEMRAEIDAAIAEASKRANVEMAIKETWTFGHERFSTECADLLRVTAQEMGMPYREMKSQAGHDAYCVAKVAPTCMIFTPCRDGLSHNVRESMAPSQTVPGANLLLNAVVRRANR